MTSALVVLLGLPAFEDLLDWALLIVVACGIVLGVHGWFQDSSRLRALPASLAVFGQTRGLEPFEKYSVRGVVRGAAVVFRVEVATYGRDSGYGRLDRGEVYAVELSGLPAARPWTWPEDSFVTLRPRMPGWSSRMLRWTRWTSRFAPIPYLPSAVAPTPTDPGLDSEYTATAHFPVAPDRRWAFTRWFDPVEHSLNEHQRRLPHLPVPEPLRSRILQRTFSFVRVAREGVSVQLPSKGLDAQDYEVLLAVLLAVLEQVPTWEALIRANQRAAGYGGPSSTP